MGSDMAYVYALLGGILPALVWLWFFLKEDSQHPEPKWLIVVAFLSGMLAVILAIPTEMLAKCIAVGSWPEGLFTYAHTSIQGVTPAPFGIFAYCTGLAGASPVFLWAAVEELLKYLVAVSLILWRKAVDEPIDPMVYLITVALGFAALETAIYLLGPFDRGEIFYGIHNGSMRFVGAALIHTLSSAVVGFAIGLTFYKASWIQCISLCTGLILAIVLHALFNHHIITSGGKSVMYVFLSVWIGIVCLFVLFERAKRITRSYFT